MFFIKQCLEAVEDLDNCIEDLVCLLDKARPFFHLKLPTIEKYGEKLQDLRNQRKKVLEKALSSGRAVSKNKRLQFVLSIEKEMRDEWPVMEERINRKMRSCLGGIEQRVLAILPAVVDEAVIPRVNNAVETKVREVVAELVPAVENVSFEKKVEHVAVLPAVVDEVVIPRVNNAVETKVREVVPAVENVTEVYLGLWAPNPKLGGWTEYGQMMLVCCATLMRRGLEPTGVGGCI